MSPAATGAVTLAMPVAWEELADPVAVNVGNPHVVFFVPDVQAVDLERLGPVIEHDPLFPARINVNVASVIAPDVIDLRVWERGAGLTRACGTGAVATAVDPLDTAWAYLAPVIFFTSASKESAFQTPFLCWSWLNLKRTPVSITSIISLRSSAPNNSVPGMGSKF